MFATPWMTVQGDRRAAGRKRAWILTSSLVLHGMALATLSGFQAWQVPAVAEPPIADVFVVQLPLPVLPAAPTHQESKADSPKPRSEAPKVPVPKAPPAPVVPQPDARTVPEHVPAPAADPLPADPQPGPTDAGPFGTGPHGNGDGTGNGSDGPGKGNVNDGPLPIGGPISRPQIIPGTRVEPRYTEMARQAHLQGVVILLAVIDERGNVVDVHVEKPLRFGLDKEAVKAVSQWKFTPGLLNGRPVKVYFDVTVKFEIR
jgi:TonB family protein